MSNIGKVKYSIIVIVMLSDYSIVVNNGFISICKCRVCMCMCIC